MALPATTKEYFWTKVRPLPVFKQYSKHPSQIGAIENLSSRERRLPHVKSHEVLVKIHAVSLQVGAFFQDLLTSTNYVNPSSIAI